MNANTYISTIKLLPHMPPQRMLNSRNMTEAGPLSMLSDDDDIIDSDEGAPDIKLPGVRKGAINNDIITLHEIIQFSKFHSRRL